MIPIISVVIPTYGLFAGIGIVSAFVLLWFRIKRLQFNLNKILQLTLSAIFGLIIGSRFVFVLTMLPSIAVNFSVQMLVNTVLNGGFVFYGGLLGAILGIYIYCKCAKLDMNFVFQTVTPCFPLFHCFGRIGCFFAGCCYGIPASIGLPMSFEPTVARFPVQLVEALCCIMIFISLLIIEKKIKNANLLIIYLSSYSVVRFILEFLRGDTVRGIWGFFSTSQWISLAIASVIIGKYIKDHLIASKHIKKSDS
ncbi:MAG: prolipoprotein diacylglyceryl transferase [Eubacterium sp.]|nr:prolipoprotein diacylglyceryl transferase [Eubacterium sp.]